MRGGSSRKCSTTTWRATTRRNTEALERRCPTVNIKITREDATTAQKAALIKGATELLVDILGKNPASTVVIIDEVELDNWGVGGEPVTQIRKRAAAPEGGGQA